MENAYSLESKDSLSRGITVETKNRKIIDKLFRQAYIKGSVVLRNQLISYGNSEIERVHMAIFTNETDKRGAEASLDIGGDEDFERFQLTRDGPLINVFQVNRENDYSFATEAQTQKVNAALKKFIINSS